jgi:transposase
MAYSTDYLCVVNNVKQGMRWDEAMAIFHISRQTLSNWLKLWEQRADLSALPRKPHIIS